MYEYQMKPLKLIIGILAILWIIASVADLFINPIPTGRLATSWWMGKITAICIGLIVAIICFRTRKKAIEQSDS